MIIESGVLKRSFFEQIMSGGGSCVSAQLGESSMTVSSGSEGHQQLRRLPSLDGWRAVSIGLVLLSHSSLMVSFPDEWKKPFAQLFDGNLGVRFFFLISGFLITWLMIKERQLCGVVDLKLFYCRRALRILPVCFAYLGVVGILSVATPFGQSRAVWLSNITFTTNFMLDRNWHGVPWPSIHLWSLAIEEQFYLIWPLVFGAIRILGTWRFWIQLVVAALVVAPVSRFISIYELYDRTWMWLFSPASFLNYFDSIAYGCVCAFLVATKQEAVCKIVRDYKVWVLLVCLAAILIPHVLRHYKAFKMFVVALGPTLQALGFAGLLVQSVFLPGWSFYRALNWPVACYIGTLSFSIYIWQQLFCSSPEIFGLAGDSVLMLFPAGWLFAGLAALLSYHFVERPVMNLRARFRPLA